MTFVLKMGIDNKMGKSTARGNKEINFGIFKEEKNVGPHLNGNGKKSIITFGLRILNKGETLPTINHLAKIFFSIDGSD